MAIEFLFKSIKNASHQISKSIAATLLFAFLVAGCTTSQGPLELQERYFLIAENNENAVLYRVTIRAKTKYSDAHYSSGWYPEAAVDAVFGNIDSTSETNARTTKKAIEDKISQGLKTLHAEYIDLLINSSPGDKALAGQLIDLQQRIHHARQLPDPEEGALGGSRVIEYNPASSILTFRDGTKQVIFLSANPDGVIGAIDAFAQATKDSEAINGLVDVIVQNTNQDHQAAIIEHEVRKSSDLQLSELLKDTASAFANTTTPITKSHSEAQLKALLAILGDQP